MAKVERRKAAKDYPDNGILKGEEYYYVQMKTGPRSSRVLRSKTPFKRSQLTTSDYLGTLYDWEDTKADLASMEDAESLVDEIRTHGEEQQEKFDNMPEGLQQGDTGQMIEARATGCEAAATEIEDIIAEWTSAKEEHDAEVDDFAEYAKARDEWDEESGEDEPEEVADPGDFDEDDFISRVHGVEVQE